METVTRKRLGKAVLLSLLLMNVCKLGGAAEYNAAITGNETDYDSKLALSHSNLDYSQYIQSFFF